jgi:hypothetical protein
LPCQRQTQKVAGDRTAHWRWAVIGVGPRLVRSRPCPPVVSPTPLLSGRRGGRPPRRASLPDQPNRSTINGDRNEPNVQSSGRAEGGCVCCGLWCVRAWPFECGERRFLPFSRSVLTESAVAGATSRDRVCSARAVSRAYSCMRISSPEHRGVRGSVFALRRLRFNRSSTPRSSLAPARAGPRPRGAKSVARLARHVVVGPAGRRGSPSLGYTYRNHGRHVTIFTLSVLAS